MSAPVLRAGPLYAVLALAASVRVALALALPNLFWPDEIYQTIEPAHRLVFGNGIASFEWQIGLRSYVVPGALAAIIAATAPLGGGSTGYLAAIAVALSLLSLWPIAAAARVAGAACGKNAALLAAVLLAVWFDLVYFAPKALTEVIAGNLLLPAVAIGMLAAPNARRTVFAASALLATATMIRPHLGPGAAVAWLWFVARAPRARGAAALLGGALPVLAFGMIDWFTHGQPFESLLVNVRFNVAEGHSLDWGWLPKHYYGVYLWRTWTPPVALCFGALWLVSLRRAPLPAVVAVAILGSHSLLGHKEYRFVYPALPLLLLGVAIGAATLVERMHARQRAAATVAVAVLFTVASLFAGADFHRAKTPTGLGDDRAATSYWTAFGDELRAMRCVSLRDDVRGVAITGIQWQFSGGYSWLHHDVPLYFVDCAETPAPAWPYVNYVIARDRVVPTQFIEIARFGAVRVLRRDGAVETRENYDASGALRGR